jgi:hypothetical protein
LVGEPHFLYGTEKIAGIEALTLVPMAVVEVAVTLGT